MADGLCTAPDCGKKHFSKGLCQKHYRQQYRRKKGGTDEPMTETKEIPKYQPPSEILIGVPGPIGLPEGTVQDEVQKVGVDGKPIPPQVQYAVGTLQIEMMWEVLNKWAPNSAVKLELSPVQRQALDQAFINAGLTTTNPWVIIISIVAFPTIVFIFLNYDQIKIGAKGMFDDLKNAITPKKAPVPQKMV